MADLDQIRRSEEANAFYLTLFGSGWNGSGVDSKEFIR
jgi:hypothetical protein